MGATAKYTVFSTLLTDSKAALELGNKTQFLDVGKSVYELFPFVFVKGGCVSTPCLEETV